MNVFTFDQEIFFDRQSYDDCWYAYTHPEINLSDPDSFAHGYFRVSDGQFERTPDDGRCFSEEQKGKIESLLANHKSDMNLEQFKVYKVRPSHYREINSQSNRYHDIVSRLRVHWGFDPDSSVALEQLVREEPAYRLTREFVRRVLERAERITEIEREAWLREDLMDTWTYDVAPYKEPGETFDTFYQQILDQMYVPTPMHQRNCKKPVVYEIDELPSIYFTRENYYERSPDPQIWDTRYYIDRGSAVIPIAVASGSSGKSYYLL